MSVIKTTFSLQEFLAMPESDDRFEFIDGEITPKVSPKYKHASVQGRFYRFIDDWCAKEQCGRVCPEWAVVLKRKGVDSGIIHCVKNIKIMSKNKLENGNGGELNNFTSGN